MTRAITDPPLSAMRDASRFADWEQVVLNGGPPCFHMEDNGRFCLRAQRWQGHGQLHAFISLRALVDTVVRVTKDSIK